MFLKRDYFGLWFMFFFYYNSGGKKEILTLLSFFYFRHERTIALDWLKKRKNKVPI